MYCSSNGGIGSCMPASLTKLTDSADGCVLEAWRGNVSLRAMYILRVIPSRRKAGMGRFSPSLGQFLLAQQRIAVVLV